MRHPVESVHIYHRRLLSFYRAMSAVKGEWMNEEKRERERERQGERGYTRCITWPAEDIGLGSVAMNG